MSTEEKFHAAIKELEETAIVMSHLQARHSEMLRDHAEWISSHDKAMIEIREAGRQSDKRIDDLGDRITALVSGIGEFMRRMGK